MLHKKIFRIILFSSVGLFIYIFYVNLFLDSWAASVGVGISLIITDSNTGNNNGNTGNNNGNTGNNNGNTGNNNGNTGNNNLNTGLIITGSNGGKGNGGDKPIKEDKPIVSSGSNNSGLNTHPAPGSGYIEITGNNTGTSADSGFNSVKKDSSIKSPKVYKTREKQIGTKNKLDLEEKIKILPEKKSQDQNVICEEDNKNINVTKISKVENFVKFFLYGKKTNVKTSILCVTGTKDNVSGSFISMSGTLKTKSGLVKNDINSFDDYVEKNKIIKKTGLISKLSGFFVKKTKRFSSSINTFVKIFPTHMIESLALGNSLLEYFIKSVIYYFK